MNVIEKEELFLNEVRRNRINLDSLEVKKAVSKIANYWKYKSLSSKRKVVLSDDNIKINEFMLKKGYKAVTVYH